MSSSGLAIIRAAASRRGTSQRHPRRRRGTFTSGGSTTVDRRLPNTNRTTRLRVGTCPGSVRFSSRPWHQLVPSGRGSLTEHDRPFGCRRSARRPAGRDRLLLVRWCWCVTRRPRCADESGLRQEDPPSDRSARTRACAALGVCCRSRCWLVWPLEIVKDGRSSSPADLTPQPEQGPTPRRERISRPERPSRASPGVSCGSSSCHDLCSSCSTGHHVTGGRGRGRPVVEHVVRGACACLRGRSLRGGEGGRRVSNSS